MASLSMIQLLYIGDSILDLGNLLDGWSGVSSSFNCAGTYITGGYNIFGEKDIGYKTFDIPDHYNISVTIILYALDSWDSEYASITIDGQLKVNTSFQHNDGSDIWLCGNSTYGEHIYTYTTGFYSHTTSQITIQIQSYLDTPPWDESLGWITKIEYVATSCFYFYTDYNYNGDQYKFCRRAPLEIQSDIPVEIKSLKVPTGQQLLLQGPNFQDGTLITYTSDQPNLSQSFQFPIHIIVPESLP